MSAAGPRRSLTRPPTTVSPITTAGSWPSGGTSLSEVISRKRRSNAAWPSCGHAPAAERSPGYALSRRTAAGRAMPSRLSRHPAAQRATAVDESGQGDAGRTAARVRDDVVPGGTVARRVKILDHFHREAEQEQAETSPAAPTRAEAEQRQRRQHRVSEAVCQRVVHRGAGKHAPGEQKQHRNGGKGEEKAGTAPPRQPAIRPEPRHCARARCRSEP